MTRHVVCPSMLHGLSTPGNSQFAKLLFAALVCWMKELLLITDCVLYLIVLTWLFHILCAWKSGLCHLCYRVFKDHHDNTRSVLPGGEERGGGSRYKLPAPSGPEGARGPNMLPMFLGVSVVSDVIRK